MGTVREGAATGDDAVAVSTAWGTGSGRELPPVERDMDTWNRVTSVLGRATPALLV
ncbi:hypothetical protein ACQEVG_29230 [Streptomyces sp. CA-135486]|uniref:hypothetical protein n=1 Tax=Streptomyces sp. CA-135486 TaxID=3240049 RepID=UPI003D89F57B